MMRDKIINEIDAKCYYHAQKLSKFYCESCGKLICDDCCEIEKKEEGSKKSNKIIRHYLCKPCYYDKELSKIKSSSKYKIRKFKKFVIFPILIVLAPIFAFLLIRRFFNSPLPQLIVVLMLLFVVGVIEGIIILILLENNKKISSPIKKLNNEKAQFFSNVNTLASFYNKKIEDLPLKCPYCNTQLTPEIKICSSCGMDIR